MEPVWIPAPTSWILHVAGVQRPPGAPPPINPLHPTEDPMPSTAARYINPDETMIQGLHAASSILLVKPAKKHPADGTVIECRGCITLAPDCTKTARLHGATAALDHLDEHLKARDAGAKDAIWKLEACAQCRGAGRMFLLMATTACETCGGDGKNPHGKDRGVRRGVVVG